jgi:ribosomal protein S24E
MKMEVTLIKEQDNPLLSRKRMTFEIEAPDVTPSRLKLKEAIAHKLKSEPGKVIIRHVYTRFGSRTVKAIVHVYDKEEDAKKMEDISSIKRNSPKEKKDAAQAAA